MAYAFKRSITLDHTQVPSTQSGFPVLVKFDASNVGTTFKTVGNSGHIQNTGTQSGGNAITMPFDCVFTSDSGGTTKIPWEVESYDGTNGILWVWVLVSSVSSSTDTVIYVFYDDATVNTQQNTSTLSPSHVWDSNYGAVWHLPDGSSLNLTDSTSNANTLTNNSSVTAVAGQVDGAAGFTTAAANYLSIADNASFTSTDYTIEAWYYRTGTPSASNYDSIAAHGFGWFFYCNGQGHIDVDFPFVLNDMVSGSSTLVSNTWYHVVFNKSGTTYTLYLNGVQDGQTVTATTPFAAGGEFDVGAFFGSNNINGYRDEVKFSTIARSADWIKTEYNNQNNPESFSVVGAETSAGSALTINVSDTTNVTESVTIEIISFISKSDTTAITESVTLEIFSFILVQDTTPITELVSINIQVQINVNDTTVVTENVTIELFSFISISDTTAITENIILELFSYISVSDTTNISELVSILITYLIINVSDTTIISETTNELITILYINVSDTSVISEVLHMQQIGGTDVINVSDTTIISESFKISEIVPIICANITLYLGWSTIGYILLSDEELR